MGTWEFTKGLHEVGNGIYAYLQPSGAWGLNNAGLIVDGEETLLIDTLFDVKCTKEMLTEMQKAVKAAQKINTVINTHANGDHCWGNQLVADSDIIASKKCAQEIKAFNPKKLALLMQVAKGINATGFIGSALGCILGFCGIKKIEALTTAAPFVTEIFGQFNFGEVKLTPPNKTFEKELDVKVGDKNIKLIEVGPAHTKGDVIVYSENDKIVYTGDILFADAHPIIWTGPVSNWIMACDAILKMDVEVIVPGHGPIADKSHVEKLKTYLNYIHTEAFKRYEAGLSAEEAARDIALDDYKAWGEAERIVINIATLYKEFSKDTSEDDPVIQFAQMARLWKDRR